MTKALIIGGGIGGPVAAMALQRAGVDSVVYEARDQSADYTGFFLNTASNGLAALRTIGVDVAGRADGFPIPNMVMWSGSGRRLGEVANGLELADGTVSLCVKRGLLQRLLREEALSRGSKMEFGKRMVSYDVTAEGVVAEFADGSSAVGDPLIGSDGIHSRTRQILDPGAPKPHYTGLIGVGGYSRSAAIPPTIGTQHFVFGTKAFFGYLVRESDEIYWFANLGRPVEPSRDELARISVEEWRGHLLELFADDMPIINQIIAASTGTIGAHVVHDIPTSPVWRDGPVVLIGDAAHATSPSAGQGASLVCEDAVMLAKCLRDQPDRDSAFTEFERRRRERVEKVVAYSRRLSNTKATGPVKRVWRDLTLPLFLKMFASKEAHAWMYRYHIDF